MTTHDSLTAPQPRTLRPPYLSDIRLVRTRLPSPPPYMAQSPKALPGQESLRWQNRLEKDAS